MTTDKKISFLLSFVAGFMDAAGYLALSKTFVAHVTGNLVVAAASIAYGGFACNAGKILLLPVFFLGVVMTNYCIKRRKAALYHLVWAESIFLLVFSVAGYSIAGQKGGSSPWVVNSIAGIGILGLSIQNTYMKMLLPEYLPTTTMTGNITAFSSGFFILAEWLTAGSSRPRIDTTAVRQTLTRAGIAIMGFALGCFIAGLLLKWIGLIACILPALLLLLLYYRVTRRLPYTVFK